MNANNQYNHDDLCTQEDQAAQQAGLSVRYLPDLRNVVEDTQVACIDSEAPNVACIFAVSVLLAVC